tara:strand:- start:480 stop:1751 length:1272 start_codon:yes stop_codon:yes gene_type:complete
VNKIKMNNFLSVIEKYWPCCLVLLAIIGFVSKSLYNYPIGIMAILGLYRLIVTPKIIIEDRALKLFSLAFLSLWLPLLFSMPDAVNPGHSAHTIFPYLRFFFAGIFIIQEISKDDDRLKFITAGIFFIVFFWCIDAFIQFIFGENILGSPYEQGHITGMFYPRNTISHICSILSTICFIYIYINFEKRKWILISLAPLFFIVLLSGRRAAWIMLILSSFGFLWHGLVYTANRKNFLKVTSAIAAICLILVSATIIFHKPTNDRFNVTLGLFSNDYKTIDNATASRLPLWETALTIFKHNPINGIGPRGYRHVYTEYSDPDDYWHKLTQTHPHLLLLEIMAETGILGLIGYLLIFYPLIILAKQSPLKEELLPFLIPVIVALFPFNAHMAFYGSIWSSVIWLLLALYFTKAKLILVASQNKLHR